MNTPERAWFPSCAETIGALKILIAKFQHVEAGGSPYQKQIVSLQVITILWMCVEAAVSIFAAIHAHSVALLGFGADSGIEVASAFVVFLRFKNVSHMNEKTAARFTGLLLFALAAFILGISILTLRIHISDRNQVI